MRWCVLQFYIFLNILHSAFVPLAVSLVMGFSQHPTPDSSIFKLNFYLLSWISSSLFVMLIYTCFSLSLISLTFPSLSYLVTPTSVTYPSLISFVILTWPSLSSLRLCPLICPTLSIPAFSCFCEPLLCPWRLGSSSDGATASNYRTIKLVSWVS